MEGFQESGDLVPSVHLYVEASSFHDEGKDIKFNYTVDAFTDEQLAISLKFDTPGEVSTSHEKDYLVIQLRNFRDKDGNVIAEDQEIRKPLPTQSGGGSMTMTAEALGAAAATSVGASFAFNGILNIIMSASMN